MQGTHNQDRSSYLEMFRDSGIVDNIEQLNRIDQQEFDQLVSVLGSTDVYSPLADVQNDQFEMLDVPKLGIDERIKRMRIKPDQKVPVKDYMEQGSNAFEDCLLWYATNEKTKISNPL